MQDPRYKHDEQKWILMIWSRFSTCIQHVQHAFNKFLHIFDMFQIFLTLSSCFYKFFNPFHKFFTSFLTNWETCLTCFYIFLTCSKFFPHFFHVLKSFSTLFISFYKLSDKFEKSVNKTLTNHVKVQNVVTSISTWTKFIVLN